MDVKITYDGRLPYIRKPNKTMATETLIIGRSLADAIASVMKKRVDYSTLIASISGLTWETESEKRVNVIPMLITGYFAPRRKTLAEILLSSLAVSKILNLYSLTSKQKRLVIEKCLIFDYDDYVEHYEKWEKESEIVSEIQDVAPLLKRYTQPYKSRTDVLNDCASDLAARATKAELGFAGILNELGIEYAFQYPIRIGSAGYIFDFYLETQKIAFEIDGEYHNTSDQVIKDRERDAACAWRGILVLRISNYEVLYERPYLISKLREFFKIGGRIS